MGKDREMLTSEISKMDVKEVESRSENSRSQIRGETILPNQGFSNFRAFKGHLDGWGSC